MSSVSIIIPALNEEARIEGAVRSAFDAGAEEVFVADGGSVDRTRERARAAGAEVIDAGPIRGRQLNAAAARAAGEVLLFLHADTTIPADATNAIAAAIEAGAIFGGFRIRFAEPGWKLRVVAALINLRTRLTRCPWGDQAQFVRRDAFDRSGKFREWPIMEDYDLAVRMKRFGASRVLRQEVTTSGRRFLERGVIRTAALNWWTVLRWRFGVRPEVLAAAYRARR